MLISELFDAICWEISVESGSTDFQLVDGLFILAYRLTPMTATFPTVPAPGSSTVAGTGLCVLHLHDCSQPSVSAGTYCFGKTECERPVARSSWWSCHALPVVIAGSICRAHGAPHSGHTPRSLVPALIHGAQSTVGNVAKWASLKLPVAMSRRFADSRLLVLRRSVETDWETGLSLRSAPASATRRTLTLQTTFLILCAGSTGK